MNPHLQTAIELYKPHNIDMESLIGMHLSQGIVISTPRVFALCYHAHSSNPKIPVAFEDSDTLFVTVCCGHMASVLETIKDCYEYVSFQREFKGSKHVRLMNMKKLYSKLR